MKDTDVLRTIDREVLPILQCILPILWFSNITSVTQKSSGKSYIFKTRLRGERLEQRLSKLSKAVNSFEEEFP